MNSSSTGAINYNNVINNDAIALGYEVERIIFIASYSTCFILLIISKVNNYYHEKYDKDHPINGTKFLFQNVGLALCTVVCTAFYDYYSVFGILPNVYPALVSGLVGATELTVTRLIIFNTIEVQYKFNHLQSPHWMKHLFILNSISDFVILPLLEILGIVLNAEKYPILAVGYSIVVFFFLACCMSLSIIQLTFKVKRAGETLNKISTKPSTGYRVIIDESNPNNQTSMLVKAKLPKHNEGDTKIENKAYTVPPSKPSIVTPNNESVQKLNRLWKLCLVCDVLFLIGVIGESVLLVNALPNWNSDLVSPNPSQFNPDIAVWLECGGCFVLMWWSYSQLYILCQFPILYRFQYVQNLLRQAQITRSVPKSDNNSSTVVAVRSKQ